MVFRPIAQKIVSDRSEVPDKSAPATGYGGRRQDFQPVVPPEV